MDFQVSARKWRPQKFTELIGQEHIVRTLKNAIELDRIAHAYLFSGTRGVGKTTTARILAKALNCENGPTIEPCDACTFCTEIREGSNLDVLEIDGASNNGINEVRELIENIQYSTSSCRYKVYIIDEVHMLSKPAFNALLKTLEEPPPKVVFIFATTELIKIPETILSRCQCFEFKPLSHKQIVEQLDLICKHDKINIDPKSLEEIAKNGAGSMRDSQSLLDQVIAFSGREVDSGAVESVLGVVGQNVLATFMDHVIRQDGSALMELVQEVVNRGKDLGYFCRDLIEYIRNLMLVQVAQRPETLMDGRSCDLETLQEQAPKLHADQLHQMFNVLTRADMDMKRSSLPQMIFEMAVLRLTDVRPFQEIDALIDKINTMESPGTPAPSAPRSFVASTPEPRAESPVPTAVPAGTVSPAEPKGNGSATGARNVSWEQVKKAVVSKKRVFDHYLANCRVVSFSGSKVHLSFPDPYTRDLVQKEENLNFLKATVGEVCGLDKVEFTLDVQAAVGSGEPPLPDPPVEQKKKSINRNDKKESPSEEEILKDALDIFGGMVIR
jgi:DNA polymerase-3 subunit gamma/tau